MKLVKTDNKKTLVQISAWLKITPKEITPRHRLYCYSVDKNQQTQTGYIYSFRYRGFEMCLEEFISRRSPYSPIDSTFPDFIAGIRTDAFPYAQNLLIELDDLQQKIRLYMIHQPTPAAQPPLRVCSRCLMAIESREGKQITREIHLDDGESVLCDWCENEVPGMLYEIL